MGTHATFEELRQERQRFWARIFLGLALSIFLHVIVSVATYQASLFFEEPKPLEATLIDWIEPTSVTKEEWAKTGQQVVRKAELPKDLIDLNVKPKRRFLSEDKQTVKKEMQARASGMTENREERLNLSPSREARSLRSESLPERLPEVLPNSIFSEGLGDVYGDNKANPRKSANQSSSRELVLPTDPRRNRGISTTGERLPADVQIGDFTALNTDRFMYYTFYARIEEQIRHRWVRYVKAAIFGGGDLSSGKSVYVTNIEIVLDRQGHYLRAIVHQGSGSRDMDAAPVLAFREAQRIPHPPREMVKDDGTIRLFYSFHVDQLPPLARAKTAQPETQDEGRQAGGG